MNNKEEFFNKIKNNIERDNFHITVVQTSENPRFAYTIGNLERLQFELVLAGNVNYLYEDILRIFNSIVPKLTADLNIREFSVEIEGQGVFKLIQVDESWSKLMMLGVYDYFKVETFKAYQILSDNDHYTLDIPNMSERWDAKNIIWKWLDDKVKWDLDVPRDSQVTTELNALFGEKITEVTRWEENEWEAFTQNGEDVDKDNLRVVPIATLLGIDDSLKAILKLNIEDGLWREDENSEWNNWE
ncbi:DUF4262 domain-containing protein [Chryseobacterium sp. ERMR1:04]|uniref:DUF4262 domain-containing protein n=1 Tax=Chryseobacterium sp. ERMR1:04 TaxID=1705393 RepID=UPI0006C8D950|nr:DUF4262 domain-containing protein [Chryseobacterium sp. ERMR1:04]KPH14072.1 hypothetical protein AMQ68_00665 [Chryseobacterium sp. ERMR1:04]